MTRRPIPPITPASLLAHQDDDPPAESGYTAIVLIVGILAMLAVMALWPAEVAR